jgi:hypothetical protein
MSDSMESSSNVMFKSSVMEAKGHFDANHDNGIEINLQWFIEL